MVFSDTSTALALKTNINYDSEDYIVISGEGQTPAKSKTISMPFLNSENFTPNDDNYFSIVGTFIYALLTDILTIEDDEINRKVTVEYTAAGE